jgi:hypothetical protein
MNAILKRDNFSRYAMDPGSYQLQGNDLMMQENGFRPPSNLVSGPIYADNGMNMQANMILQANTARFIEAHFSEPLTNYSVGWAGANPELEANLEFLAPAVVVGERFEYAKMTNIEQFIGETIGSGATAATTGGDIRAIGSDFSQIKFTASKVTSRTYNKGLTVLVDLDEVKTQPDWEQRYTGYIMKRLNLNDCRRAIAILKAASSNTGKTWKTTNACDPDMDQLGIVLAGTQAVGMPLNRIMYGITAWQFRLYGHRAQATAGGFASSLQNVQQLADFFGVNGIRINRDLWASAGYRLGDTTNTKSATFDTTWGTTGIVLSFIGYSGQTKDDPSTIKRFISNTVSGTQYRVYRQEISSKLIAITVEHYSNVVLTSSLGPQQTTVS